MSNIVPNFFIVGAPKSGTTSLYEYLKRHPQVFLPRIKELNFFCNDLHFRFPLLDEKMFLAYYADYQNEHAAGEVSVWNLCSKNAAENIYRFNPDAKIIILLREPIQMMQALHSNHVFNDNEIISNFKEALDAKEDRKRGMRISGAIKCPVEGLYYFDVAAYSEQVKRYFDIFGQENVKVILFDEFVADAKKVYTAILNFIGVDEILPASFKVYNANKTTRSKIIKRITVHTPSWLRQAGKWLFPHQSVRRDRLMFWLWKVNTKKVERTEIDPVLRKQLSALMQAEITSLENILQRDLSHWRF